MNNNVQITMIVDTVRRITTAFYSLSDAAGKVVAFMPSFHDMVKEAAEWKKTKYLQRYRRRGERMKKGHRR